MQTIIKKVTEAAGISEVQATLAIETIVSFIKEKLPPMMHEAVDNFIKDSPENDEADIL